MIYIFSGCGSFSLTLFNVVKRVKRSSGIKCPSNKTGNRKRLCFYRNIIRWSRLNLNFYAVMSIKI